MIDDETHARTRRHLDTEADDLAEILHYRYDEHVKRSKSEKDFLEHGLRDRDSEELRRRLNPLPSTGEAARAWRNSFGVTLPRSPVFPESISVVRYIDDMDRVRYDAVCGRSSWTGSHGWVQISMTHAESRDMMRHDAGRDERIRGIAEMLCDPIMTLEHVEYADSAIAMMDPDEPDRRDEPSADI